MDELAKEVKIGWDCGNATGATIAGVVKIGSHTADGLEPACRKGIEAAQVGGVAGGLIGATALGTLSALKTARHGATILHQNIRNQHNHSHPLTESCILCNPTNTHIID